MAIRKGHGTGRGQPRIEVRPSDELPNPVPAPLADSSGPIERRDNGQIANSEAAKELGRLGGAAKARKVRLIDSLGLSKMVEQTNFGPYRSAADEFVEFHLASLAKQAGGSVGPAPSTMVASAGLQLAASRWAFDQGAEKNNPTLIKLGSQLANDSRQNLLAAYDLAVLEAKARKALGPQLPELPSYEDEDEPDPDGDGPDGGLPAPEPQPTGTGPVVYDRSGRRVDILR